MWDSTLFSALTQISFQLHRTALGFQGLTSRFFDDYLCILINQHLIIADQRNVNASFPLWSMLCARTFG